MPTETIYYASSRLLSELYANDTRNLIEAERMLDVVLASRDDWLSIEGSAEGIARVQDLFKFLEAANSVISNSVATGAEARNSSPASSNRLTKS